MKLNVKFRKIFFGAIVTAAISLMLSACTYPFSEAALEFKATDSGLNIPQMSGLIKQDDVNNRLSEIFTPYAEQAQKAVEASNGRLSVVYDMVKDEEKSSAFSPSYTINMRISDGSGCIDVTSAEVSGLDNVTSKESGELPWLNSADIIIGAMDLKRIGFDVDLSELYGDADEKFALEFFIDLYETVKGSELDISDITVGDALGDEYKKALKLGFITSYYDTDNYEYAQEADCSMVLNMAKVLINAIERDVYGRQSELVTGSEFADILRVMYNVCLPDEADGSDYRWADFGDVDFNLIAEDMEKSDSKINRRDCAELLTRIAKAGPTYNVNYNDRNLTYVDDSNSIWVRRAITYSLMRYYGDSVVFAPNEKVTLTSAISMANDYISTIYSNWGFAVNYTSYGFYSKYDVMIAASKIADYFGERPAEQKNSFEVKNVINDRDYNWFYSQHDTGKYSDVNCMPSIATMAAHWCNEKSKATVEKMRNTSDITEGWSQIELENGLSSYNVPYTLAEATMENILNALDDGKIVLAQYSDRPFDESGHCYVIYGYRKFNNSVTFIVNDSDSLSGRAQIFGRPSGNGDEIEANFSMWSIKRFVSYVIVVG